MQCKNYRPNGSQWDGLLQLRSNNPRQAWRPCRDAFRKAHDTFSKWSLPLIILYKNRYMLEREGTECKAESSNTQSLRSLPVQRSFWCFLKVATTLGPQFPLTICILVVSLWVRRFLPSVPELLWNGFLFDFRHVKITLQRQKSILPKAQVARKLRYRHHIQNPL